MAAQQNPRHQVRSDDTSSPDSNPHHTQPYPSDLNPSPTQHPPAPEIHTGTPSPRSGENNTDSRNQSRHHPVTDDDNNRSCRGVASPSNSADSQADDDSDYSGSSDNNGGRHLDVTNLNEGPDYSDGNGSSSSSPSCPSLVGGNISVDNRSDSGYSSGSGSSLEDTVDFFVDSQTLLKTDNNSLHQLQILYSLCRTTGPLRDVTSLVQDLQKDLSPTERSELLKHVEKRLPGLVDKKRWTDLASFLRVDCVRSKAIDYLDLMVLELRNNQDSSLRDQLLAVGGITKEVMLDLGDNCPTLLPLLSLHLAILAALVVRCSHPQPDQWSQLAVSKKQTKKKGGSSDSLKQVVLKTLQTFHEGLDEVLQQAGTLRDGAHGRLVEQAPQDQKKALLARASFCEVVVTVFSLLNEVKHHEWDQPGEALLEILHHMCTDNSSASSTKPKIAEECKGALDFFLARQTALLLHTTFDKDKPQAGPHKWKHHKWIIKLLVNITCNASPAVRGCVLEEVKWLSFHKAKHVRSTFEKKTCQSDLAQGHLAKHLQVVGFCQHHPVSLHVSKDQTEVLENCSWKTFSCTIDQKPAKGFMYVPKAKCLGGSQLEQCLCNHPGSDAKTPESEQLKEASQRNITNLDMLRSLSPRCQHLASMYCYQYLPFPMYIRESCQDSLLNLLLECRNTQQWLSPCKLVLIAQQLVALFAFLSEQKIDPRGVTCYSLVIQPESGSGSGSRRSWLSTRKRDSMLNSGDFTIKLSDLGLAHQYMNNSVDIRPVAIQGPIPVRWLSREALFEGQYGEKNMVHNLGCLLFELWTHGAQPYTSYDTNMTTEEILQKMLVQPGSIVLARFPCMTPRVHKLIRECTHHNPEDRPSLDTVLTSLKKICAMDSQGGGEPGLHRALSLSKRYPAISQNQMDRKHIPDTGLPKSIQKILHEGKKSKLYRTTANRLSTMIFSSCNAVTEEELTAPDEIRISHLDDRTVVSEVVSADFGRDVLPSLTASEHYGITCYNKSDEAAPKLTRQDGLTVHTREYAPSVTLENAARYSLLWEAPDPVYDEANCHEGVLVPLKSLARALKELHTKGWMMRDLREENILVKKDSGEVILPRIARMLQLPSTDSFVVDEVPLDSWRRVAPEVLVSRQYGKENDIFMFGRLIQQIYRIHTIAANNPRATRCDFAPCPNIVKEKLKDYTRDPDQKEVLEGCPDWLCKLSMQCCDPDPEKRPTAAKVNDILLEYQPEGPVTIPFIRNYPGAIPHSTEASEEYGTCTVQLRRKNPSKHHPAQPRLQYIWRSMTSRLTPGITARLTRRRSTTGFRSRGIWKTIKKCLTRKTRATQGRATVHAMSVSTVTLVSDDEDSNLDYQDYESESPSYQNGRTAGDPHSEETLVKGYYDTPPSDSLLNDTTVGMEYTYSDPLSPGFQVYSQASFSTCRPFHLFPSEMTSNQQPQEMTLKSAAAASEDSMGLEVQCNQQNSTGQDGQLSSSYVQLRTLPPFPSETTSHTTQLHNSSSQFHRPRSSERFPVRHPICLPHAEICFHQVHMRPACYTSKYKIPLFGNLGDDKRTDSGSDEEWDKTHLDCLEEDQDESDKNTESETSSDFLLDQGRPNNSTALVPTLERSATNDFTAALPHLERLTTPDLGRGGTARTNQDTLEITHCQPKQPRKTMSRRSTEIRRLSANPRRDHCSRTVLTTLTVDPDCVGGRNPRDANPETTHHDDSFPQQQPGSSVINTNQPLSSLSHPDDSYYARLNLTATDRVQLHSSHPDDSYYARLNLTATDRVQLHSSHPDDSYYARLNLRATDRVQLDAEKAVSSGAQSRSTSPLQARSQGKRDQEQATTDERQQAQRDTTSFLQASGDPKCHARADTINQGRICVPEESPNRHVPGGGGRAENADSGPSLAMACTQDSGQDLTPTPRLEHLHLHPTFESLSDTERKGSKLESGIVSSLDDQSAMKSVTSTRKAALNAQTDYTNNERTVISTNDVREGASNARPDYANDDGKVISTKNTNPDASNSQTECAYNEGIFNDDKDQFEVRIEEDGSYSEQDTYCVIQDSDVMCDPVHISLASSGDVATSDPRRSVNADGGCSGHSRYPHPAASLRFTAHTNSSVTAVTGASRDHQSDTATLIRSVNVTRASNARKPGALQSVTAVTRTPTGHQSGTAVTVIPTAHRCVASATTTPSARQSVTSASMTPTARQSVTSESVEPIGRQNVTVSSINDSYRHGRAGEADDRPGDMHWNTHAFWVDSGNPENSEFVPIARSVENRELAPADINTEHMSNPGTRAFVSTDHDTVYEVVERASTIDEETDHTYLDLLY